MKKFLLFLTAGFLLNSCKDHTLDTSFIYFYDAQPVNVDAVTVVPKKFLGTYSLDNSHQMIVEPKLIFIREIETIITQKSNLDSAPEFELKEGQVYDKVEDKVYKTVIKGDSISFEIESRDTIFSFSSSEIAKVYKSSLILNKKLDNVYQTSIIKVSSNGMQHIQLGTKKDFTKLNQELNIPFEVALSENDTLHVIYTPSRADFRKLLRKEGFEYETHYLFSKREEK